ncbi:enoyl-CoA hydratase/isomerase family protein [Rhodovibrionaceae bacterium A322]
MTVTFQEQQASNLVTYRRQGARVYLRLNRPDRHNALVPELMAALLSALNRAGQEEGLVALVLEAEGRSFSTGGDVGRFYEERERIEDYAQELVGQLNQAILALVDLPIPVISRVQGPITGGSLGLMLASDLVAMADDAFLAPYYVNVGFSPDGGWAALLPSRIGAGRAKEIQLLNRHVSAQEALTLGLATAIAPAGELPDLVESWLRTLEDKVSLGLRAAKGALLSPEQRSALASGLERERQLFVAQVGHPQVIEGLRRFLGR